MSIDSIYIGGTAYGIGNIGDDGILQGILKIIELTFPKVKITCGVGDLWNRSPPNFLLGPQKKICHAYKNGIFKYRKVYPQIKACDCYIQGGSTFVGEELGIEFPMIVNIKQNFSAKFHNKPALMIAVGANKLNSSEGIKYGKNLIYLSDLITLRDVPSKKVCLELGSNPLRTFSTADPAILLNAKPTKRTNKVKQILKTKGKIFGINVVNEVWFNILKYKAAIAKAADYISSHYGYTPVFFCNEIRPTNCFDYFANMQTINFMKEKYEILDPVYYRPEEMIDLISNFDFIVSMRMHTMIYASIVNVPFVAISRIDKVDNFLEHFGFKSSISIKNPDHKKLISDIEGAIKNSIDIKERLRETVPKLRTKCLENVKIIKAVLNNPNIYKPKLNLFTLKFLPFVAIFLEEMRNLKKKFQNRN
ncbi:MAG: polysaccharide pyruvyl transferase family protein [Candidatus Hodarchaeota archaeon]